MPPRPFPELFDKSYSHHLGVRVTGPGILICLMVLRGERPSKSVQGKMIVSASLTRSIELEAWLEPDEEPQGLVVTC